MASRLRMTARNAFWSYFSMCVSMVISFVSRTVFIHCLGESYLGINGLFSNILGVLSFAELGIGTAINFSLYKPVAEHDVERIKTYMYYYKCAYRIIALIISIFGLALLPFLHNFVKDPGNVGDIRLYYSIFLFNTVSSYFVSYKFSLVNAEQKNYIFTNVNLIIKATLTVVEVIALLVWRSFLVYLLISAAFGLFQKIFVSHYLNKLYPFLRDKNIEKLPDEDKRVLIRKVKALVLHKIGDVSVHQTDNIIVSAYISTTMVGLLSNYNMLIGTISGFIRILFNSVVGSLGNLVATESKDKQYDIFCKYRFIGFWFYGFTGIALSILMTPFIRLWIGDKWVVDQTVINLILIDYYMIGQRICLNNFKTVSGVFEPDKYVALIQAVVNLIASIILAKKIGLAGVFAGTIIQGTISTVLKPILSFEQLFEKKPILYFVDSVKYCGAVALAYLSCSVISRIILNNGVSILPFVVLMMFVAIVPNVEFALLFMKTKEFCYFKAIAASIAKRISRKRDV